MSLCQIALAGLAAVSVLGHSGRDRFVEHMLKAHNVPRAAVGLGPLRWDPRLAADAAVWARQLSRQGRLVHERQSIEGENLWRGTVGAFDYEDMVDDWANERADYQPGLFPEVSRTGNWRDVGHYTQMVWRDTSQVGCAMAQDRQWDYLVCRYSPPGNWSGQRAY